MSHETIAVEKEGMKPTATHCNTPQHAATNRATKCKKARKKRSAHNKKAD